MPADTSLFDRVAEELEQRSALSRIEARGTVRLALKEAGLDAAGVTAQQMAVVLRRVLPAELKTRRIDDGEALCAAIAEHLAGHQSGASGAETPEAVFARLASR